MSNNTGERFWDWILFNIEQYWQNPWSEAVTGVLRESNEDLGKSVKMNDTWFLT